jgi:hypothetical protein
MTDQGCQPKRGRNRGQRPALDPARAPAQGLPADGVLLDPQRAAVLRAAALSFAKNRERLLKHNISRAFFEAVLGQPRPLRPLSSEQSRWTGPCWSRGPPSKASRRDRTWAASGSPRRGREAAEVAADATRRWTSAARSGATRPTTPPPIPTPCWPAKATVGRPGSAWAGHVLMENRNGMVVDIEVTRATGTSEREAGLRMLLRSCRTRRRRTLGRRQAVRHQGFRECLPGAGHHA